MAKNPVQGDMTYIQEIDRFPLLSTEEENVLAQRVQEGDQQARQRFIEANLRLVVSIAKRYISRGLDFMDLIGEGNLGLIKAVDRFDPARGYRFSSYGGRWIEESIINALCSAAKHQTVELSEEVVENLVDPQELVPELYAADHHAHLLAAFAGLSDRERNVLVLRYGLDGAKQRSERLVARILGLSDSRVRQVEAVALRKLRAESAALTDYWQEEQGA